MKKAVPQTRIKRMMASGMTDYAIQKKLHYPLSVLRRIRDGKDVPYYIQKTRTDDKDMCEFCGQRKKAKGMRFLCDYCYKYAGNQVYSECSVNV